MHLLTHSGGSAPTAERPGVELLSPHELARLTLWKWAYTAATIDPEYARELAFAKWLVRTGRVSEGA